MMYKHGGTKISGDARIWRGAGIGANAVVLSDMLVGALAVGVTAEVKNQMMPIRVLMLVRDPTWYGGVVNFVQLLERNLSNRIQVNKFCIGQRKGGLGRVLRPLIPFVDATRLAWHLLSNKYDIVHVNPSLNFRSLVRDGLFLFVLKLCGVRNIVVFMHGWEDRVAEIIGRNVILKQIFIALFGRVSVVYVLAGQFAKELESWGVEPRTLRVTTTMFDGQQFNDVIRCRDDDGEFRILFLSRFEREKGVYELLGAFAALHERYPQMVLIFAGTGPEEDSMHEWVEKSRLSGKVRFLGYVRGVDKAQVFVDSDLFVFPTYYGEGCPVSLLEAMGAGLPIVTARAGGIGDFFIDGKNGRLLYQVTTETVESAMLSLLEDPELRRKMGEYNREIAWEKYEAAVISRDIENTYISLADKG